MTRIVIVSDTHMPHMANELPKIFLDDLKKSDLCIHAGDVVEENVLKIIEKHCPCNVVAGNMDSTQIQKKYPQQIVLNIEDLKIGVAHGSGAPNGLCQRVLESFSGKKLNICIYGHSHKAHEEIIDGVFCLNPGSLCDYLYAEYNSYAILEIDGDTYKHEIVKINS